MLFIYLRYGLILFILNIGAIHAQQLTVLCVDHTVFVEMDSVFFQTYTLEGRVSAAQMLSSNGNESLMVPMLPIDYVSAYGFRDNKVVFLKQSWIKGDTIRLVRLEKDSVVFKFEGDELAVLDSVYQQNIEEARAMDDQNALFYVLLEIISTLKCSPYSSDYAYQLVRSYPNDLEKQLLLKELLEDQDTLVRHSMWMNSLNNYLNNLEQLPQVQLDKYALHHYEARSEQDNHSNITVLDFWNTACKPCRADHQKIKRDIDKGKLKEYNIVGICTDRDTRKNWQQYLDKAQLPWHNYIEIDSIKPRLSEQIAVDSAPYYVVLDENGNILGRFFGYDILNKQLAGLLIENKYSK